MGQRLPEGVAAYSAFTAAMVRAKKFLLWSLGLTLALALVIGLVLATAGDGFYRWVAQQLLAYTVDRPVHLDGTFSFDLGWEPSLVATDVWIENASWADKREMARIERAEVRVRLKPLFSGILYISRLVLHGATLDLEKGPDGEGNWELAKGRADDAGSAATEDPTVPLFEHISLKDIVITYRDRQSGRSRQVLLESLQTATTGDDAGLVIQGTGNIDRTAFRMAGRFGSVEDALAASVPYPLELKAEALGLLAELKGTVRNLPRAQGFDMSLAAQVPSLSQALSLWESDLELEGRAEASARLRGNLASLAVEDLVLKVVERSGQELQVKGSAANLLHGKGLALRFNGKLGPNALRPIRGLPHQRV